MRAGRAADRPVTSCWISASSRPATISRGATTRAPTRCTRCRCGCVHRAAWPSCWPTRPCPRSRGAPSPPRSSRRPPTPWTGWPRPGSCRSTGVVAEYGSPHGGSWLGLLADRGLVAGRRRAGRRDPRLLRPDARRGPAPGPGRARGPGRAGRGAAAAVPRAEHDHRQPAVERAAARPLRVLLDHRADRHAGRGRLQPAYRLAVRPLRRHRPAGRAAGTARAGPDPTRRSGRCSPTTLTSGVSAIPAPSPACSAMCAPTLRPCMTGWPQSDPPGRRVRRLRCRVPGRGAAVPGGRGSRAAAGGGRRLARQAGPADAGYGHPGGRPGRARRAAPGRGAAVRPRPAGRGPGGLSRRSRRPAAGGSTRRHWAHDACSRTRSRARQRPRVGPMLPTGSPSSSEMSA